MRSNPCPEGTQIPVRKRLNRGAHECGQVFIMVVLLLGVMGGMAAIAVDLGSYSAHRRDLQNAADAIALAAAQELPDEGDAQAIADEWAERNGVDPADVTVTVVPQSLPSQQNPEVRVEIAESHGFAFAPLVGIMNADVAAAATAIKTSLGGHAQLVPWAVEEEVKATTDPGEEMVLKYDSNNVETGNFGAIRIDGEGASIYGDTIQHGSDTILCASGADCVGPSQVSTQTGNMVGQTRTSTDYRIDNTDPACDTWEEVVSDDGSGSMGLKTECNPFIEGGNPDSLRVIVLPIISSLCNGSCDVTITDFALFFLEGYGDHGCTGQACEIAGRFIGSNTNTGALVGTFDADSFAHFVRLIE